MAITGPLFKWFGSKWLSSKHYPPPAHDKLVEPYAGSASYSLRYAHLRVVIWDTNPYLRELWPWLINIAAHRSYLISEIPINVPVGTDIHTLGLTRGQELLLKSWQRTNPSGGCWTISSWGSLMWTANVRARIAAEVPQIAHWEFFDPTSLDHVPGWHWFIDPPYQFNDFAYLQARPDYAALARRVEAISPESTVVVCEGVGKHGERPTYLPFVDSHAVTTSRRGRASELVYVRPASLTP